MNYISIEGIILNYIEGIILKEFYFDRMNYISIEGIIFQLKECLVPETSEHILYTL